VPVRKFPFKVLGGLFLRPLLPVIIINPHTGEQVKQYGIIDTGADCCTVPAYIGEMLGHNIEIVPPSKTTVVGGEITTWEHTTTIQMLDKNETVFYENVETYVEYVEDLEYVLIGVDDFLCDFKLEIDYPNKHFSITNSIPEKLIYSAP
jgi:predicted aspartyl protease